METLVVEGLSFTYPDCREKALDNVSFTLHNGDFMVVCGATGSGKSTLLRMLKRELAPFGEMSGRIMLGGRSVEDFSDLDAAQKIGYVLQRPEQQIVTDRVWHELAFGLENLGLDTGVIRRRVAEMACYFDIEDWFERPVSELSGGQKQLLNLASVMVMQPELLLLDEPTAQLDPIAASDFISTLARLNRDLSLTVIIVEHRLDEVIPVSNKLLALEEGKLLTCGPTRESVDLLRSNLLLREAMPVPVRIAGELGADRDLPITVREGRRFTEEFCGNSIRSLPEPENVPDGEPEPALEFSEVYQRYSRELPDVLSGMNLTVNTGECLCILGGNGSGKSTALGAAAAINKIYSGTIKVFGKKLRDYRGQELYDGCLTMLPQDVQTMFLCNTVREELKDADLDAFPYDLTPLLDKHPYDLSGGQQQLVGLARVLSAKPRLLLLDEPTKGLDAQARRLICEVLHKLQAGGMTLVVVTHDTELAAMLADRCAMLFRGEIVSCGTPRQFFSGNSFYTTPANRMTRGHFDGAVTAGDVVALCRLNAAADRERSEGEYSC